MIPVVSCGRSSRLLRFILLAGMALSLAVMLPVSGFGNTPDGPISPLLQKGLDHPLELDLQPGAPLAVWVFFKDKDLTGRDLSAALAKAEERLSPRARLRRAKVAGPGQPVVDGRDLPVAPRYIAAVTATGAKLRNTSRWLNAASFTVDPAQVLRLAALPQVLRLDLVHRFRHPAPPDLKPVDPVGEGHPDKSALWTMDYGLNRSALEQIDVPAVHEMGVTGRGVVVGMLDTGFRTTHEALAGLQVLDTYDFVDNDSIVDLQEGDLAGVISHGTMTLSTLAGHMPGHLVAPAFGVSVLLARTEDISQEVPAEEDHWVAGLEWAEARGADIISSSLAYIDWYTYEDLDGNTAVTTIAADLAVGRGLVVVNSMGNSRASLGYLLAPADGDSVISVGAVTLDGNYTTFSSPGPTADGRIKPDVMALGRDNPVANPTDDQAYVNVSGTSFSCPLTAGVAALMLSRVPSLTPMQVREALHATAGNAATPNNDYGWGIVDAYAAVTYFGPVFQVSPPGDTEDTTGPYPVTAVITDRVGVDEATTLLNYRVNGGPWTSLIMSATGNPGEYLADIPGQDLGTTVEYYIQATGLNGFTTTWPVYGQQDVAQFQVTSLVTLSIAATPDLVIPMDDPAGISSVIQVSGAQSGTVVSLAVDVGISHPDIGELTVLLTSPAGTEVTLHRQGNPGTENLVGNYPETLGLDGPGSLDWFHDETSTGPWTLTAIDDLPGNNGVIDSWGLHFVLKDFVSAGGHLPVARTELFPNSPNPFNPRTRIAFTLDVPGQTRLSIFDLRGMVVRRLLGQYLESGYHSVLWDGRDAEGKQVGSGVYLYLLEAPSVTLKRKMVLVR